MSKWIYTEISSDLSAYNYNIDSQLNIINIKGLSSSKIKDYSYLKYPSYKRKFKQKYTIQAWGFYYAFISFWERNGNKVTIDYSVINPGEEHLSSDAIPNKTTYLYWLIISLTVFVVSIVLIIVRIWKASHLSFYWILILINYFLIMIYWISKYIYWVDLSLYGSSSLFWDYFILSLEVLIPILHISIINLIAIGFKIVHQYFQHLSFVKNVIAIGFYVIILLLLYINLYFVFIFMIIEIIVLLLVLRMDVSASIKSLKRVLINERSIAINDPDYVDEVKCKIWYYKIFQVYLYVYWIWELLTLSLKPFLLLYHEWIFALAYQILILISMSFLFITINYSLGYRRREQIVDFERMPLPFNKKKDAKILGEILFVHSIWDDDNGDADKIKFPRIAIGVECSYHRQRKVKDYKRTNQLNLRSEMYLCEDNEELARNDVLKIVKDNNHLIEECKHRNFDEDNTDIQRSQQVDSLVKFINKEKEICDEIIDNDDWCTYRSPQFLKTPDAIFKSNKIIDFRNKNCFSDFAISQEIQNISIVRN